MGTARDKEWGDVQVARFSGGPHDGLEIAWAYAARPEARLPGRSFEPSATYRRVGVDGSDPRRRVALYEHVPAQGDRPAA